MKLYYARHGQTDWNAQNRVCSTSDIPLNDKGIAQAHELAKKAAELGEIDLIIASPMKRAKKTAEIVAQAIDKPIVLDERLREWDFGRFDGADREEAAEALRLFKGREFALPMGETGETLLQLNYRVYAVLEDIKKVHADKTILVVAHGGVCRMIETYFNHMTAEEFADHRMGNCELRFGEISRIEESTWEDCSALTARGASPTRNSAASWR